MAFYSINEQLIWYIFVEGNAYNPSQLAKKLGVSKKYLENTVYKNVRENLLQLYPDLFITERRNRSVYTRLKYDAYATQENFLISLYRMNKNYKTSELVRNVDIIRTLSRAPKTLNELIEEIEGDSMVKRRSYERSLKYLREIGVVSVIETGKAGPYVFTVENKLLNELDFSEIIELYYFVQFMSNTNIQAAKGYLLSDVLSQYIISKNDDVCLDGLSYRFLYFARLLYEYKMEKISEGIEGQKYIEFRYFSKNNTEKTFKIAEREQLPKQTVMPIRLIHEHQYGRTYLIAKHTDYEGFSTYRLEGIFDLKLCGKVAVDKYEKQAQLYKKSFKNSWIVDYKSEVVTVKLKFYFDRQTTAVNFIKERVTKEKQWGKITEETDDTFIFEIDVKGTWEIKPWIRSFGSSVEVIAPINLRKEMRDEWKRILKEYRHV